MSYHDEVFRDEELATYKSIRQIQLWLLTIGHLDADDSEPVLDSLEILCEKLGYELVDDEQLGRKILKC